MPTQCRMKFPNFTGGALNVTILVKFDIRSLSGEHTYAHSFNHYTDVIISAMASQITSSTIVYPTVYSRRKSKKTSKLHAAGLCEGIHRWPVNSAHKGPVKRKMFPFDDVIMTRLCLVGLSSCVPGGKLSCLRGQIKSAWTSYYICKIAGCMRRECRERFPRPDFKGNR